MSLATRCTSCSTVFRVVQDQLRVSSGWVRCGRCGEVFNAIESLVDLDVERPEGPVSVHGSRVMEDLARFSGVVDEGGRSAMADAAATAATEIVAVDDLASAAVTEEAATPARSGHDWPSGAPNGEEPSRGAGPEGEVPGTVLETATPDATKDVEAERVPATPDFVRRADRAARWRHPAVRSVLALGTVIAMGGLGWQLLASHHDWIAARWPMARPAVEAFCAQTGCQVRPPRVLDALAVDSSGLTRAPGVSGYRLVVAIRNRSDLHVRVPALDLALTDTAGSVIARRVVALHELGEAADSIGPGAELGVTGLLRVDGAAVTGYTVEIFYP